MNQTAIRKPVLSTYAASRAALVGGLFLGACTLGGLIAVGAGSNLQTLGLGVITLGVLSGAVLLALNVPLIGFVRFAFIGSFFFKGDLSLFKINEVEDPSGLNLSLTLGTGIVLLLYDYFHKDKARESVFPSTFWFLFTALFVCTTISVLYAGPTLLGGFSLFSLFSTILIAFVTASHFARRDRVIQLVVGLGIGLVFTGLAASSQYFLDFPTTLPSFGTGTADELAGTQSKLLNRVPAFLRTPTEMAWVVSSLLPVVLAPLVCRVKSFGEAQRAILVVAVCAGAVAVILSLARGSWLGVVTTVGLLLFLGWYQISSHEKPQYLVAVFSTAILISILLIPFAGRIHTRLMQDDQGSAQVRVPLLETAVRMIDDNPVVGVGPTGYRSNMTKYDETAIFVSKEFPNPVHNIFAHITAEVGIPAGILFCLLILFSLYECCRTMTSGDRLLAALALGLGLGMIAFVISGVKEPGSLASVRPPIRTCFFLFGMILALSRIRRRVFI